MRLHRLFGILSILLSRETITAKELSEKFQVSVRTIYRDIEAIDEAGIPLYTAPGNNGGIGIVAEYKLNKTVLSDDEMSYLITGLSGLKSITDTNKLQILLSKLAPSSPYMTADSDILIDFSAWNPNITATLKQKVELIRMAILKQNYLQLEYISSHHKSTLKIAPAKVIFKSAAWYLFGKSDLHQEFRFYKITRIAKLELLDEQYLPEPVEIPSVWNDDFKDNPGQEVTIAFHDSLEYQVIDLFGPEGYSKGADQWLNVTFCCADPDWLIHFLLGFGIKVKVIGPAELRENYYNYLKKLLESIHC